MGGYEGGGGGRDRSVGEVGTGVGAGAGRGVGAAVKSQQKGCREVESRNFQMKVKEQPRNNNVLAINMVI